MRSPRIAQPHAKRLGAGGIALNGLAICLFVVGAAATSCGAKLLGAEALLWSQLFWALAIQRRISGRIVVYDLRVAFIVVYTLYGSAVGLSTLWGLGDLQGLTADDPGLTLAVLYYAIGAAAFNIVQLLYRRPWIDFPSSTGRVRRFPQPVVVVVAVSFLIWFIYAAVRAGVEIHYDVDRTMRESVTTQGWIVAVFLMQGFWMFCIFNWRTFGRISQVALATVLMATVLYFTLSAGARRDVLTICIFAVVTFMARRRLPLDWRVLAIVILGLMVNLWLGVVREDKDQLSRDWREEVRLALGNNEFSIPAQNLVIYIESNEWKPRFGSTYIRWPEYFIPRAWWSGKPKALAWETFDDTGRSVPTYTPVVEAYVNFVWAGPAIVMGMLSALFAWLVSRARKTPVLYFMLVSLVFDFNRGEFGLTVYSIVVISAGYWLARISAWGHSLLARPAQRRSAVDAPSAKYA